MKKVFAVLLIFLMCFSFSACLNGNEAGKDSNKEGKIPSVVSYYPQKDDTAFTNPDTGWVFYDNAFDGFEIPENMFSYYAGLIKGKVQTIAVMSTWGYIEKEEGVYDWSLMDKSIDFWESQGFDIHLRFCTDFNFYSVQSAVGCPEYLYTKYEVPYQIRQVEGNNTAKFPDYNHPKYQEKLGLLLDELFERYAGRPAVKMVDLRAFGLWGEWHTGYQYEDLADRQSALKSIIDIWSEKLQSYGKYLMLSSSYDPDYTGSANVTEFMQKSAFDYAMTKDNVAIRRDGIGGAVHYGYNGWFDGTFCDLYTQSGKRMPLVIEMMPGRVDPYYNFERMLEEALSMKGTLCCVYGADKGGINSFIGNPDLVNKGNRELGYRFEVDEAQYYDFVPAGATQSLRLSIKNSAVGRAYKDYPMKIEILNRQDDTIAESILTDFYASEVIKGESFFYETQFPLPKNLPEGKYRIVVSVCDPVSSKNLRLGIVDGDQELRYPIGEFRVDNEYKSPESFFVEPMTPASGGNLKMDAAVIKETTIGGEKKDVWQFEAEKAEYFNLDSLRLDEAKLYRLQIHYKIEDVCRDINGFAEKFYVQIGDVRYEFGGERGYCGQINRLMKGSERISVGSVGRGTLCIADVKVEEIKFFIKLSSFELQRMETTGEFDDTEVLKSIDAPNFSQISFSFKATKTPSYVGYFFVRMKNEEGDIVREIRIYDREEFMKFAYSYALPEGTESLDFGIAGAAAGNFSAIYLYK